MKTVLQTDRQRDRLLKRISWTIIWIEDTLKKNYNKKELDSHTQLHSHHEITHIKQIIYDQLIKIRPCSTLILDSTKTLNIVPPLFLQSITEPL